MYNQVNHQRAGILRALQREIEHVAEQSPLEAKTALLGITSGIQDVIDGLERDDANKPASQPNGLDLLAAYQSGRLADQLETLKYDQLVILHHELSRLAAQAAYVAKFIEVVAMANTNEKNRVIRANDTMRAVRQALGYNW
jgi:hypothetical protein